MCSRKCSIPYKIASVLRKPRTEKSRIWARGQRLSGVFKGGGVRRGGFRTRVRGTMSASGVQRDTVPSCKCDYPTVALRRGQSVIIPASPEALDCCCSPWSASPLLAAVIDLLMGLFRWAVCHHGDVPEKCPLALMGRFPSLMGRFPTSMGRFPECLNGPVSLSKILGQTAFLRERDIERFLKLPKARSPSRSAFFIENCFLWILADKSQAYGYQTSWKRSVQRYSLNSTLGFVYKRLPKASLFKEAASHYH